MPQVLERAAGYSLAFALPMIKKASTFGAVITVLKDISEAHGNTDTADSLQGQMQYGLRKRGQKARKEINALARAIVARVGGDHAKLTDEDRDVLMQYSGRGGIADDNSLSEYYTPQPIAEGVWDALAANGFENGNVLEPSTGAGVFLATKPAGVKVSGAEIDSTSSSVTALLHPDDDVAQQSFEQLCATAEDNSFDSVIGNVPFGDTRGKWAMFDPEYQDIKEMERYFVTRAIDKVRHGGLVALIVPPNIISKRSKTFSSWRRDIGRKAEFLGAHKLPSGTFGGANGNGTDTIVDVLIMRKHSRELTDKIPDLATTTLEAANVYWDTFISGRWFEREGKRFVHGEIVEGFRTRVESQIDNQGLKRLMARKFDSRIDYDALGAAATITRNYLDGDRRVIGMQMHELVAGEWQKVDAADGVQKDGRLDVERYGIGHIDELKAVLNDAPSAALALSAAQASNAVKGRFNKHASQTLKQAVYLADSAPKDMRERIYRAALVGAEISSYARSVSDTGQADTAKCERLQNLVTAEVEKYGNPAGDSALRMVKGQGASNVAAFARSMTKEGGFSDLLTGKRTGERGQAFDTSDPADVIRHLCVMSGAGPIDLEEANELYTGSEPLTLEALAKHDGIAITAEGYLQPMEYYASGNVVQKITALERAAASESNPAIAEKMRRQVDVINARRVFTDVDNITFSLRDKWYDRKLVERFLNERGHGSDIYFSAEKGKFEEAPYASLKLFSKQLFGYLNGQPITSSKADKAAEYKQQARDLEDEFNVWMRQQDEIDSLVARYNDVFNDHVPMEFDGSDLQLENVADWITPHDYQAAGVRRLSDEGRGILAFDVGLGKTLSALSLAQYNAQKGRAKRTAIVVPKAVLENWYHETRQFHKSMDHVHFVGFTPKTKGGDIEREMVLDEEGNPKVGRNGEVQYRDVLAEDSAQVMFDKMNDIPQTSKTLVVMSRERFGMIPLRPQTREGYADRMASRNLLSDSNAASLAQGEDVKLGRGGSYDEVKQTERYQAKFSNDGTRKKGEYPFFEDMGFDSVIVDEGHEYKNTYQASGETQRLAYLPTPQPSQRSVDMAVKMDYLRATNNDTGPVLLTATPVTNSPIEIYNMLSHIVPAEFFERMGINNVDDFVQHFCHIEEVSRTKLSGEVVYEEGVAGFQNLDALRNLFHRFTNMKSAEDVNDDANSLKMPDSTEIHATVDMTREQAAIYEELRQEADLINQEVESLDENGEITLEKARPVFAIIRDMDRITTDMDLYLRTMTFTVPVRYRDALNKLIADLPKSVSRRLRDEETGEMENVSIALDERFKLDEQGDTLVLVVSEYYETEVVKRLKKFGIEGKDVAHPVMPKYAKLLENLRKEYENGGKQIIFTEEKSQHDKLKRIITHHLPIEPSEIGIINADTASGDKLEKISGGFNTGKVRIVIANKKAEVGVNLQKGTTAIHHLTLPWTPASIQQRNGRGVRQGNTSANVDVIYYLGKGSFDTYRLETLKRKSSWIKDLFYGTEATAANANAGSDEDMAIMLAANPEQARERIAAQRQRKEQDARERSNRRASIDLANLQKHKAFLADFQSAVNRATYNARERGRSEEEASARMDAKREKVQAEIRQIESRLVIDQDKGRIDLDAKRLIHDGHYLTTLNGNVIEPGQVLENQATKSLYRVASLEMNTGTVHLKSVTSTNPHDSGSRVPINMMSIYHPTRLTNEQVDQYFLEKGQRISYLSLAGLSVDDAYIASRGTKLLERMTYGQLVVANAKDELMIVDPREAASVLDEGGHIVKPRLDDREWRDRLAATAIKARRQSSTHAVDGFVQTLLGKNWLPEALQAFGNLPPKSLIVETAVELLNARRQKWQDQITNTETGPLAIKLQSGESVRPWDVNRVIDAQLSICRSTFMMVSQTNRQIERSLEEAGYDIDEAVIDTVVSEQVEPLVIDRIREFLEDARGRLVAMAEAQQKAREASEEKERQAAAERIEQLNESMPDSVKAFFDGLGIDVKLNAETTTWHPKGGGRRKPRTPPTTSQPGERFMLFDPNGRSGTLASTLAGNKSLQSRYNATWTIFDGNLWWHMPATGIDYDELMEAFE